MRRLICGLCAFLAALIGTLALAEGNLVQNGDFEAQTDGLPDHWTRGMWFTDEGVSLLTWEQVDGRGGCASVYNVGINDARFAQTLSVRPDTVYRITGLCRAEGIPDTAKGATLSADGTFSYSNEAFDTAGEWVPLELIGRTGPEQTELTLFCRVGGYGSENSGRAWFDDIAVEALQTAPAGADVQDLTPSSQKKKAETTQSDNSEAEPPRYTQAWILLILIWAVACLAIARRAGRNPGRSARESRLLLCGLLAAALLIRLILAARVPGYNTDINCFSGWASHMISDGPARFYDSVWCDYPPLYMWMLAPIGALLNLSGFAGRTGGWLILLKLWPMLFDLAGAALLWRRARRTLGDAPALLLSALFALNPAVFVDSAAWGQIDSIFTFLLAWCALDADDERYVRALTAFALAMLVKPQALLFAPIGLVAILVRCALVHRGRARAEAFKKFGLGTLCALGAIYLVALVSTLGHFEGALDVLVRPVTWIWSLYASTFSGYRKVTINALNLYNLFGLNWADLSGHSAAAIAAWTGFVAAYIFCALLLVAGRKERRLPLIGGVLIVLVYTFGPMIHERYLYPAILLLLLGYVSARDWRVLLAAGLFSVTLFLNEVLVLQGGMTQANFGHLQASENWINRPVACLNVLGSAFLCWTAFEICVLNRVRTFVPCPTETKSEAAQRFSAPRDHRLRLTRVDAALMAAMTCAYALVAFVNLGTTRAPQSTWTSHEGGEQVVFDLGEVRSFRTAYYGNICSSNFTLEFSNDSDEWTEPVYAKYGQGEIFRWLWFRPMDENGNVISAPTLPEQDGSVYLAYSGFDGENYPFQTARYVRLTAVKPGLKLMEVAFIDAQSAVYPVEIVSGTAESAALVDEQDTVPDHPSYYNSSYFDEIYHPRTAYEHLHGLNAYEWTHPPLGKVLMMVGIALFGMTPFGWRFMGTLMGVAMLPVMYLLIKQLTRRTSLSAVGTFLLMVDSMHFTQTRLATIDSYAVFWIMLMYLFMFRFTQMPWENAKEFRRSLVVLGLCGVTMGIAWATKWIGLYASAGLAILFFATLIRHILEARHREKDAWLRAHILPCAIGTLGFCVAFYIVIPLLIYYFSYFWHLRGIDGGGVKTFWDLFHLAPIRRVIELQKSIYGYHAGLSGDTHPFRSPWYQWPVIAWPMWYYSGTEFMPSGMISSISCMGNPAVWWFSLAALIAIIVRTAWLRRAPDRYWLVIVAFASQFLPWVLVPRSTFIYHYFASVPFLIIAGVLALEWIGAHSRRALLVTATVLMAASLGLFVAFYPLESGLPVARSYANHLRWFNWSNF